MLLMIQFLLMIQIFIHIGPMQVAIFTGCVKDPFLYTEQFPKMEKIGITLMFLGVNVSGPIFVLISNK